MRRGNFPDPPQGAEQSGGFGPSWGPRILKTGRSRCMRGPRVHSSPNRVLAGLNESQAHGDPTCGSPGAWTCQKGPDEAQGSILLGVIQYQEKVCFQTLWHQYGAGHSWAVPLLSPLHFPTRRPWLEWDKDLRNVGPQREVLQGQDQRLTS